MIKIIFIIKCVFQLLKLAGLYVLTYFTDARIAAWAIFDFFKFSILDITDWLRQKAHAIVMAVFRTGRKRNHEHHKI